MRPTTNSARVRRLIAAAVAAVLAVVTITLVVSDGDHDGRPDAVTVQLGPVAQARPDVPDTLTIPTPALDAAKRSGAGDHAGSRDEAPDGVAPIQWSGNKPAAIVSKPLTIFII